MRVDPFKPRLKPPAAEGFKLQRELLRSSFGFDFNLRRYTMAPTDLVVALKAAGLTQVTGRGLYSSTSQLNLSRF